MARTLHHFSFKISLIVLLLCSSQTAFSQLLEIKGIALDTIKSRKSRTFRVVLNDTLNKVMAELSAKIKAQENGKVPSPADLLEQRKAIQQHIDRTTVTSADSNLVVVPKSDGEFRIKAKLSDTLYFSSDRFITQKHAVRDLIKRKQILIQLEPQPCVPYVPCKENSTQLFAFVAEKISVISVQPNYCENVILFDSQFECVYKVVKNVHGKLQTDTVRFTAFDHYGVPGFSKYQHVLLFLAEHCGKLYHEKYQFFDVYPTADGGWARPGNPYEFDRNQAKKVEAEPIKFARSVKFDLSDNRWYLLRARFVEPYFTLSDQIVTPIRGVYLNTLLDIKKEGVLKARGYQF